MRLRIAVAMPEEGGRPAIVVCEVRRASGADGRRRWYFTVGRVERVREQSIEGARKRVLELVMASKQFDPCVFIDAGTPQGVALWRTTRRDWPKGAHRPHAHERTRFDTTSFAIFLEAYAAGRVHFLDGLDHRKDLDRALVLYRGAAKSKTAEDMDSEDKALVIAACLGLMWPTHGSEANKV